jgi:hypothetical protein
LEQIRADIQVEEQKETKAIESINKATKEMNINVQQLQAFYKDIKPIPGTADEDN